MKDINATVIVNIESNEKKILKNLHKDARWGIKRAQKEGLKVYEANSDQDWRDFYHIYREVAKKGGADVQSLDYIQNKTHTLLICKKGDKIMGGATIFFDPVYNINIPRLFKIASSKEHLRFQPNNILYWNCILWAKNKGYDRFDFGGWQINARGHLKGINKFKERWGVIVYHENEYPLFHALGRKLIRNFGLARIIWHKLKDRKGDF